MTEVPQGVYRHYKGGLYTVLMTARCSDNGPTENWVVVVYVSHTTGEVRTRFIEEFTEEVNGVDRFHLVREQPQ